MGEEFELYLSAIANKTFIQGIDNLVGDLVLLTLNYALYDNITGRARRISDSSFEKDSAHDL